MVVPIVMVRLGVAYSIKQAVDFLLTLTSYTTEMDNWYNRRRKGIYIYMLQICFWSETIIWSSYAIQWHWEAYLKVTIYNTWLDRNGNNAKYQNQIRCLFSFNLIVGGKFIVTRLSSPVSVVFYTWAVTTSIQCFPKYVQPFNMYHTERNFEIFI